MSEPLNPFIALAVMLLASVGFSVAGTWLAKKLWLRLVEAPVRARLKQVPPPKPLPAAAAAAAHPAGCMCVSCASARIIDQVGPLIGRGILMVGNGATPLTMLEPLDLMGPNGIGSAVVLIVNTQVFEQTVRPALNQRFGSGGRDTQ